MKDNSGIYVLKNTFNGKVYVGRASYLDKRKSAHYSALKYNRHSNQYLQNSYNKYGKETIIFEVLEYCEVSELELREHYWCVKLKANNKKFGYNLALTGEGFFVSHATETKKRISISHKGKVLSEKTKERISISKRGVKLTANHKQKIKDWYIDNEHPMKKGHNLASRKKMSASRKGKPSNNRKSIICLNIENNTQTSYSNVLECASILGVLNTSIQNNLKGRSKLVNKKFKFRYE